MEMLLCRTEDTTSKKIVPSMKAFMDDLTVIQSRSHTLKTAETPTGAFEVDSNEDKAF